MTVMSHVADLVLLNVLFLITSIPIFTIGASAAALYAVASRIGTEEETGVLLPYFRAFRDAFGQGTTLWLMMLAVGWALAVDALLFYKMSAPVHYGYYLCVVMEALLVLSAGYVFPLISLFKNRNAATLKNAVLLCVGYLPRSIFMAVLHVLPWVVLFTAPGAFFQASFIWAFFYFSAAAYADGRILRKVFAPLLAAAEMEPQEER